MQKLFIPVIAGTTREKRKSIYAARFIADLMAKSDDIETLLVDPKDFNVPGDGNDPEGKDPRYSELTGRADGFLVVVPEYNHSFPGSLKRLLDSELANYRHKPVAFAGASSSAWGGVRGVESLVNSVREMGLVATSKDVYFPRVQELFDGRGMMVADKRELYEKSVAATLQELIWMARVLKYGREHLDKGARD